MWFEALFEVVLLLSIKSHDFIFFKILILKKIQGTQYYLMALEIN